MASLWSTESLEERDRFAFWREELLAPLGIFAEPDRDTPGRFAASLASRQKGPLQHVRAGADPHQVMRRRTEIARRSRQGYSVYHEIGLGCWLCCDGQEFVTRPGEIVITDADIAWESRSSGRYELETVLVPKNLLDVHLPRLRRPLVVRISGRTGAEAVAADYYRSLLREWDRLDAPTMEVMADTLCRLLAVVCGAAAEHPEALREARRHEAMRHIERHLSETELSPARAAAALGISVRALHLLFEPTGNSFSGHVTRRRLGACRVALASPGNAGRSVADIAFAWGFNSLPTFYRAFQREFGIAPGEFRAGASRGILDCAE